ncbi:formin-binding protein 1-like isoform X6 [Amphibalanus amphitrite]|uniref:formin-binding protein 1-like isoform X4 n=1 Tax=Amphibalanus amphitrite TaxID=1232801 RepID=UPI001C900492|nr:formin-binding protein 1-like isoform X4 [Amphibalanus amphitrite]XP_043202834.1 formin-binding protein 1-like isoform X4 [Amphibalanus amphitrite]XP_043202835.1 formin-binding protein 1-like isoform X4 [Amphibalanus amphitrite]XP_043214285.1 formin-binding protein 1-like isoform X6 [Amphibalanus amphitrite]XP_043214295.1 formin-binding protein 1-like isoform X6 [Amphibalanus amphitrite]XP_043214301.1 formin-binding protein 1-like isoform X6 [Amphibalanus amphitrite]
MAWGTELWDQFDNVSSHTLKGLEFLEKYGRFQKDRCDVENRYAADLRGLVKKYMPKKKDEEDGQFSVQSAYRRLLAEVGDLAGQHEVVAEQLADSVAADISAEVKTLKEERKRMLQEGNRLVVQLQAQRLQLDKSKKNYEKAFREAEKAQEAFRRADADLNLSRAEVEKQKMAASIKGQQSEDCKNEYANQLQRTNDLQHLHYTSAMPALFGELQALDERRARCMQAHMRRAVDIERHVFPIVHTCLDGIVAAADEIDPDRDSQLVIERYKSGFEPPEPIPFEDLSDGGRPPEPPLGQLPPPPASSPKPHTVKGTLSARKFGKRGGIFGIFGGSKEDLDSLPPNQRRKRIQNRMDDLAAKISQETSTRDGLMKMKGVYESNPALGDPLTIESQLRENTQNLERLRLELHKFQRLLDGGGRTSLSEPDSNLSRSASDSSMARSGAAAQGQSAPSTPPASHGCSNSPESGLGTSHTSLPDSESDEDHADGPAPPPPPPPGADDSEQAEHEADFSYGDEPALPVLGQAKALYAFDAASEGSIPMQEGEQLLVIELDQGDGWTRVRRHDSLEEGFVPTAYLQVLLHPAC